MITLVCNHSCVLRHALEADSEGAFIVPKASESSGSATVDTITPPVTVWPLLS